jgi:hypothetical protein
MSETRLGVATPSVLPQPTRVLSSSGSTVTATSSSYQDAKPWNDIPKTKTTLGLNVEMMKSPLKGHKYMQRQAQELGNIFRATGVPSMPELVCVMDPHDIETVYRAGDTGYPERFPFYEWQEARKELNKPTGVFME